ncbi:ankyrin repeat-containing protein ITN1-like [Neltuma alba]|uniref:ankyrin repeat-containing protein ITN1-like n=1 Tax=Neltuma alba TaxID=207710 RepID=UPI0010A3CD82|nr:ankyrin repeat-containing protein ITN1-like [Prosopis alba]
MEVELNQITTSCGQMSLLYEAAYSGDVSTLNSLIQQRPRILHNISQTTFTETPLHISSLLGHLQFTKELITLKPNLAIEVDSSQRTALHLASAEGHIHVVKELIKVNNEACLKPDEEGRIPLHYAAMRGRTKVVQELIKAKPESLSFRDNGKTVFHLCVTYNHLETLTALVELESAITGQLFNFTSSDNSGNTVLHLAVMLKRLEAIRYLVPIPKIREVGSLKNKVGLTVEDIIEHSPKDFKICEIQLMLTKKTDKNGFETTHPHTPPDAIDYPIARSRNDNYCITMLKCIGVCFMRIGNWFEHKGDWLEEIRGNLSLVSTVTSTITFQSLVNPPGGFIQQGLSPNNNMPSSFHDSLDCTKLKDKTFCPGQAISSFHSPGCFECFVIFNTVSFMSSLGVTVLLVSGVPLKNKVVIRILSLGMCCTIYFLACAYVVALHIVVPGHLSYHTITSIPYGASAMMFFALCLLTAVVFHLLRIFIWVVKKCVRIIKEHV